MAGLEGGEPPPDDLLAELARWSAGERAREAVTGRVRVRHLVDQSASEATLVSLLLDLAEADVVVTVDLAGGHRVAGRLVGVGRDLVALDREFARPVLVRTDAVVAIAPVPAGPARPGSAVRPGGRRPPPLDLTFAAALDAMAGDGASVGLHTAAEAYSGILAACGEDVVTLKSDRTDRRPRYVALGAVIYVEVR